MAIYQTLTPLTPTLSPWERGRRLQIEAEFHSRWIEAHESHFQRFGIR